MFDVNLVGEEKSVPGLRFQKSVQRFNLIILLLLLVALGANLLIVYFEKRSPTIGIARLLALAGIAFLSFILAKKVSYHITAGLTIFGLYLAFFIYPFFSLSRYPEHDFFMPLVLTFPMCFIPMALYSIKKDLIFIFGWILLTIITAGAGFFYQFNRLVQSDIDEVLLPLLDNPVVPLAHMVMLVMLVIMFYTARRKNYNYQQKLNSAAVAIKGSVQEMQLKQKMILEQNEELKTIQQQLQTDNSELEIRVSERKQQLQKQKEELLRSSFMNSHMLRAPVARILGLKNLLEITDPCECKFIRSLILDEIQQLDQVSATIAEVLDDKNADSVSRIKKEIELLYKA